MRDYASLRSTLLDDLGDGDQSDYHIFSDMDNRMAARTNLRSSFYKKLCPKGTNSRADEAALKKFIAVNGSLPEGTFEFLAESESESCFWDYFRNHLNTALAPHPSLDAFDLNFIREHMNVGPGAAQKADSSYMVSKLFESTISYVNPDLIRYYRAALAETGLWADAEMQRFSSYGFTKVRGGKIFFAAKNAEISRTCCTEANLEMLIQKAIGAFLLLRLKWYFGISLEDQAENNRELARKGSIDGSIGTIDLISASDCMSLSMLDGALHNTPLKGWLWRASSRQAVLPDGSEVDLRMISTMGNGFTFPLQTIIFASAVRAVYDLCGYPCKDPKTDYGVFGDDICVRKDTYDFLSKMLNKLGFQVNGQKSFNTGPFRESCGHDYFNGVNIRGVYVKSLETPQQVYSCINRLVRWSAYHGILLPKTIALLRSWVRDMRIPPSESDDAGIQVPFKLTKPRVSSTYAFLYRCYKRRVRRMRLAEPDAIEGVVSPFGLAVGFLSGVIRRRDYLLTSTDDSPWQHDWSASVTIRDRVGARSRYNVVKKSIFWWDYVPSQDRATYEDSDLRAAKLPGDEEYKYEAWRYPLTGISRDLWEEVAVACLSP